MLDNNDHDIDKEISVWELGIPKESVLLEKIYTDEGGFRAEGKENIVVAGRINVHMPKFSAMILRHADETEEEAEKQTSGILGKLIKK